MKPGVYSDISNAAYHSGPGESKSLLDLVAISPVHYRAREVAANDNQPRPEPTAAMRIGSAFHALLLEPAVFEEEYCRELIAPEDALVTIDDLKSALKDAGEKVSGTKPELIERLKAVRPDAVILEDLKANYAKANAGRIILKAEECDQLYRMRDAVMAHPAAKALMTGAKMVTERSVYWTDPATGLLCRCRPDGWRVDGVVPDVKTTDDASEEGFARSIAKYRYHVQAAFYLDGIAHMQRQADDVPEFAAAPPKAFPFLAVEKGARVVDGVALGVAVYLLDAESIALGRQEYQRDLATIAACRQAEKWPGYGDKINSISLPKWKLAQAAA